MMPAVPKARNCRDSFHRRWARWIRFLRCFCALRGLEARVREEAEATASAVKAPCSWLDFATDNQVIPSPMNRFRLATGRSHQLGRNLVANTTDRLNETIRTQLIKLSAQTLDMHVYQRITHISVTPDHVQ